MAEGLFGLRLGEQFHQAHSRGRELAVLRDRLSQERFFLRRRRDQLRRLKQQFCFAPRIARKRRLARDQARRLSRLTSVEM